MKIYIIEKFSSDETMHNIEGVSTDINTIKERLKEVVKRYEDDGYHLGEIYESYFLNVSKNIDENKREVIFIKINECEDGKFVNKPMKNIYEFYNS